MSYQSTKDTRDYKITTHTCANARVRTYTRNKNNNNTTITDTTRSTCACCNSSVAVGSFSAVVSVVAEPFLQFATITSVLVQ